MSLAFAENWLVYSYWEAKNFRTEVTAVDFYIGQTDPNTTEWDSVHRLKPSPLPFKTRSSSINRSRKWQPPPRRGITNKALLIATRNGQIYAMPKKVVYNLKFAKKCSKTKIFQNSKISYFLFGFELRYFLFHEF